MFRLSNVYKIYIQGEQSLTALSDISIEFQKRGFVSITGESGSGKTTLLNILAGFDTISQGKVHFDDVDVSTYSEDDWNTYYCENVGFVFQEYNVIEQLSVEENIKLALDILNIDDETKNKRIEEVLIKIGLSDIKDKQVSRLSGGQKQRVAIARACVKHPKVILADEPTGNLDYDNSIKIFEMLKEISRDIPVIVVTHNNHMAYKYSDRIIRMADGLIVRDTFLDNKKIELTITSGDSSEVIHDYDELSVFVLSHPNEKNEYRVNVLKRELDEIEEIREPRDSHDYTKKNLSKKSILKLSKKVLEMRKIRYVMSIGVFAITTLLFMFFSQLLFYNEDKVISDYLEKYNENYVVLNKRLDSLYKYSESDNIVYVTKNMRDDLVNISDNKFFYQFDSVIFSNCSSLASTKDEQVQNDFYVETSERIMSEKILSEEYQIDSMKANEIIITDALAKEVGITGQDIKGEYYIGENVYELIGIVPGDEKCVIHPLLYVEYMKDNNANKKISVAGNFLNSKSLSSYSDNYIGIINDAIVVCDRLIGSKIKGDNEVIISYTYADMYMDNISKYEELIGSEYYLKDLYDSKYGNSMTDKMNLYDYLGSKIKIVGIAEFDGDICVSRNVYNDIYEDYYNVYCYDKMGCYGDKWEELINEIHKKGYRIDDTNIVNVYDIVDAKPVIFKYIVFVLLIMMILTVFLVISLISCTIKDNERIIGIWKATGINSNDIKKIFAVIPIKTVVFSYLISLPTMLLLIKLINIEYVSSLNNRAYNIIPVSIVGILLVMFFVIVVGIAAIVFPLKEMNKKTIVAGIKSIN